ncbi:MAG: hypothetical protein ACYC3S_17680 [Chloroflexota bacterium]
MDTAAAPPDRARQLVYNLTLFDGIGYTSSFAPASEPAIYVLAGKPNVISPAITYVYFWPITSSYRADLQALNDPEGATLEIVNKEGQRVAAIARSDFTLEYPEGVVGRRALAISGEDARRVFTEYKSEQETYYNALSDYYTARDEYTNAFQAYLGRLAKGEKNIGGPPTAPVEPIPPKRSVNKPDTGFVLNLPGGEYLLRLRDAAGNVVAGSERLLKAIEPRRYSVGYQVFAEDRWTLSDSSNSAGEVIYTTPDTVMYLQPSRLAEFADAEYAKVLDPQSSGSAGNWRWINIGDQPAGRLRVGEHGRQATAVDFKPYAIQTIPGSAWGYEVEEIATEAVGTRNVDFWAYRMSTQASFDEYDLEMIDGSGKIIDGSGRTVRAVHTEGAQIAYAIPLLPLLLGVGLALYRRRTAGLLANAASI